jgi:hypothetical protein
MREGFDASFLVGKQLLQVAIGVNEVIFRFDEGFDILAATNFDVCFDGESSSWTAGSPESASCVLGLLGQTISKVEVVSESLLRIKFASGSSVDLKDDSDQFESFTISRPGSILVV